MISIDRPDTSSDIPLEDKPQDLSLRWIARPAPRVHEISKQFALAVEQSLFLPLDNAN